MQIDLFVIVRDSHFLDVGEVLALATRQRQQTRSRQRHAERLGDRRRQVRRLRQGGAADARSAARYAQQQRQVDQFVMRRRPVRAEFSATASGVSQRNRDGATCEAMPFNSASSARAT